MLWWGTLSEYVYDIQKPVHFFSIAQGVHSANIVKIIVFYSVIQLHIWYMHVLQVPC